MKNYVGAKIVKGEPMNEIEFLMIHKPGQKTPIEDRPGYHVVYPGTTPGEPVYHSWLPKEVWENAYREITDGEMALILDGSLVDAEFNGKNVESTG